MTLYLACHISMLVACSFFRVNKVLLDSPMYFNGQSAVNCPLALRGANWIFVSSKYITYFSSWLYHSSYFVVSYNTVSIFLLVLENTVEQQSHLGATGLRGGFDSTTQHVTRVTIGT